MIAVADATPRDAASLVIVDSAETTPRVLLGKRRLSQVFAPGKYVFPGGSLDDSDNQFPARIRLSEHDQIPLAHGLGPRSTHLAPEAFALAAIRETFEETGIAFGTPQEVASTGFSNNWNGFLALGVSPNLGALTFVARAITPPGRPRRFDARFFLADATAISHTLSENDGEFEELVWVDFTSAIQLNLHGMTRQILDETAHFIALSPDERRSVPVPYYYQSDQGWHRSHIPRTLSIPEP